MILWIDLILQYLKMMILSGLSITFVLLLRCLLKEKLWSNGRMILWYIVIFFMMIPFSSNFSSTYILGNSYVFPPIHISLNTNIISSSKAIYGIFSIWNGSSYHHYYFNGRTALLLLSTIWASGFLILLFYIISHYISMLTKIRKFSDNHDYLWVDGYLHDESLFWGIKKKITIKFLPKKYQDIHCPVVIGIRNPTIVIPYREWTIINKQQQKLVISHELLHIKHNDNRNNLILWILQMMYWINPLIWIGFHELRKDIETQRDSQLIRAITKEQAADYAIALFQVAKINSVKSNNLFQSGFLSSSGVGLRIKLIKARFVWKTSYLLAVLLAAFIIIMVILLIRYQYLNFIEFNKYVNWR